EFGRVPVSGARSVGDTKGSVPVGRAPAWPGNSRHLSDRPGHILVTGHGIVALIASRPAFGPVLYSTTLGSLGTLNTTMAVCRGTAHIGEPVFYLVHFVSRQTRSASPTRRQGLRLKRNNNPRRGLAESAECHAQPRGNE